LSTDILSALVLGSIDLGESDRLVHLLTRERGRLTVRARGARRSRKRYGGKLDRFSLVRVHVTRRARGRVTLGDVDLVEPFLGIRGDLLCTAMADHLIELARIVTREEEVHRELFGVTVRALSALDRGEPPPEAWHHAVVMELMRLAGLAIALDACCVCGASIRTSARAGLSLSAGGVICSLHLDDVPGTEVMRAGDLGRLRLLARMGLEDPSSITPAPADVRVRANVRRFCEYHLEQRLRSGPFLDQLLDVEG